MSHIYFYLDKNPSHALITHSFLKNTLYYKLKKKNINIVSEKVWPISSVSIIKITK